MFVCFTYLHVRGRTLGSKPSDSDRGSRFSPGSVLLLCTRCIKKGDEDRREKDPKKEVTSLLGPRLCGRV